MTILYARIRAGPPLLLPSCSGVDGDGPKYTANTALDLRMAFFLDNCLIRACNLPYQTLHNL